MSFTASTRQVLAELGLSDPKTLHRRREDYSDKGNPVSQKIFQQGVHFVRQTPSLHSPIVWDRERTVRAWRAATVALAMTLQDRAAKKALDFEKCQNL